MAYPATLECCSICLVSAQTLTGSLVKITKKVNLFLRIFSISFYLRVMFWKKKKKDEFKCAECGEIHEGWPALGFWSPDHYMEVPEGERDDRTELSDDFCIIKNGDETYRFIRVTLTQKVVDGKEDLDYGLWVSLSEKSYNDYEANYDNTEHEVGYFGWLCNWIPGYESTLSIPVDVYTRTGNQRPYIVPHPDHAHQFVKDYADGITSHEAQRRVDEMLGNLN